ncbi:MAG: hypothetical protein IKW30_13490 [Lachnospiraceae bacterium]|nr:hypothetical protein [Lachnospiraceae bacterium]
MKLKYYLRGLGIGIVVTAILMSIVKKPETLSDAQIKMRALELGMVEESVLSDLKVEKENDTEDSVEDILTDQEDIENVVQAETQEENVLQQEGNMDENIHYEESEEVVQKKEDDNSTTESATTIEETIDKVVDEETENQNIANNTEEIIENFIIITVDKGNGSEIVSRKMFEAGLVNSEIQFNRFLVQNGYDRKLKVGNHEIPANATEEEMAKILCGIK